MKFQTKALLISLMFVLPLALLCWFYASAQFSLRQSTSTELTGVVAVRDAIALLKLSQQRRELLLEAATGEPRQGDIANAEKALKTQLAKVTSSSNRLLSPKLTKALDDIKAKNDTIAKLDAGGFKIYASHTKLVNAVAAYIRYLADASNLTLDPDLDTYYLMDVAILSTPDAINNITSMKNLAGLAARSGQGGEVVGTELARLDAVTEYLEDDMSQGVSKVVGEHPEFKNELRMDDAIAFARQFRELALEEPGAGGVTKAHQIDERGTNVEGVLWKVQDSALNRLDTLLTERLRGIDKSMTGAAIAVGLGLFMAIYLFYAFYLVITGGIQEVQRHLRSVAQGNLDGHIKPWGSDEAAELLHSVAEVRTSLNTIVDGVRLQSNHILSTSFDIVNGAVDLTQRTEAASTNLEGAAASIKQIASTVKLTADNAAEAADLASANATVAIHGGQVMNQVALTMSDINTASNKISEIIGVIDGIAFQTNILALNAAVEAARAGEHGRGFAVVATEVRGLAQRSSTAAREIKSIISNSVERVEYGTKVVHEANTAIQNLVDNANRINKLVDQISTGGREQALGIDMIQESITELNKVTQHNALLADTTSSLADKLNDTSSELIQRVALFKLANDTSDA